MPQKYASLAEAREAILLASTTWRQQFEKLTKVQELKIVSNDAMDAMAGATIQTMDEVLNLKQAAHVLKEGIDVTNAAASQAMRESGAAMDKVKSVEEGAAKAITVVGKKCAAISSKVMDMQLSMSENVLIIRGIPPLVHHTARETQAELERALNETLGKIKCPKLKISSIKRLQKSKRADPKSPRVMRVALASGIEKSKLFEAIEACTKVNTKVPFSCSHEIPRYAMSAFKHCNKLASLCRVGDENCRVRVSIPRGDRWPAIFIRREADQDFRKLTKNELDQVKKELVEREKREREARKRSATGGQEMDTGLDNLTIRK